MRIYRLTATMKERGNSNQFEFSVEAPAVSDHAALAASKKMGLALAIASSGMLVCVSNEVLDTRLDWSIPMIDADDREIDVDWDDEYPHE